MMRSFICANINTYGSSSAIDITTMIMRYFSLKTVAKMILFVPIAWIWFLAYFLSSQRKKIDMDLDRFCKVHIGHVPENYYRYLHLYRELVGFAEFRSLFLFRMGKMGHIIGLLMPKAQTNLTFSVPRDKFAGGVFIQHGFATGVSAHSVGENCWINQRVTVGFKGDGFPTIGKNVSIGVGAVIIGDIKIGDNVKIGANALVLHDVPDNCIVVSPEATIIRKQNCDNA